MFSSYMLRLENRKHARVAIEATMAHEMLAGLALGLVRACLSDLPSTTSDCARTNGTNTAESGLGVGRRKICTILAEAEILEEGADSIHHPLLGLLPVYIIIAPMAEGPREGRRRGRRDVPVGGAVLFVEGAAAALLLGYVSLNVLVKGGGVDIHGSNCVDHRLIVLFLLLPLANILFVRVGANRDTNIAGRVLSVEVIFVKTDEETFISS
jgi:hypothetical protein